MSIPIIICSIFVIPFVWGMIREMIRQAAMANGG